MNRKGAKAAKKLRGEREIRRAGEGRRFGATLGPIWGHLKGEARSGAKLDKIRTKFVFFRASPDESIVGVVSSFLAGTMGDGEE